jgi:acetolactate synthase-1/2/3 large subunit
VVATANARGLLHGHPLLVPASPSLAPVRALMAASDLVLALGTELGPTDYDMYGDGGFALPANMIRIDIDAGQLQRRPARLALQADCREALDALLAALSGANAHDLTPTPNPSPQGGGGPSGISVPRSPRGSSATAATSSPSPLWGGVWDHKPVPPGQVLSNASGGTDRAAAARQNARAGLDAGMRAQLAVIETVRDTLPGAIIVGDSTQPVYAGNLYYDHDRPGGWFNAATGYGALGYALPAAIGAALANPAATVVCLAGDGGFQFTLPEIGVAAELGLPVILLVWNNEGYREIETSMRSAGVEPVGVSPAPPDFQKIAAAYGIAARRLASLDALPAALRRARASGKPCLIEIGRDLTG